MGSHQNGQQGGSLYKIARGSNYFINPLTTQHKQMGELKVKMITDVTTQWLFLLSRMRNSKNVYVNPILLTVFVKIGVS